MAPGSPEVRSTPSRDQYDAAVIGSGPNGLAAAIVIARTGRSVVLIESKDTVGGGMRSAELTLPGFTHDVCSAIHALAVVSPFFKDLPLADYGLEWVYPPAAVAHPLDNGMVALGVRDVAATAAALADDEHRYQRLFGPLVKNADKLFAQLLGPFRFPRNPYLMFRFARSGLRSATGLARKCFRGEAARALFAGHAAHSVMPLEKKLTAAVGIMLALTAHAGGWPVARGGSQRIADAMASYLASLGGEIVTGWRVESLKELPRAKAYLFDTGPHQLSRIAGDALPPRFRRKLERFRYGPAAFKLDWALDAPIPWTAKECLQAGTVHVGGTAEEIAESERAAWKGDCAERPFVLVAQQSLFDDTRAPSGKHVVWGYCHVPNGSNVDMTERIEAQIERFAPGFRDRVLARHVTAPNEFEGYNENYVGGDITGGVMDWRQLFARPVRCLSPYTTPAKNIFICSASTPPGAGVHGMCGYHAANVALRRALRE